MHEAMCQGAMQQCVKVLCSSEGALCVGHTAVPLITVHEEHTLLAAGAYDAVWAVPTDSSHKKHASQSA